MFTSHNPVYDAKNRHGLPDELPLSFEPIAFIYTGQQTKKVQTPYERLAELMAEAGIEEYQVREIVGTKNDIPEDVPFDEYPEKIIAGCVKHFGKLANQIKGE